MIYLISNGRGHPAANIITKDFVITLPNTPLKRLFFTKDKYIFLVNIFANEITYLFTPPYKYADHII